jgi:hypothetical protein
MTNIYTGQGLVWLDFSLATLSAVVSVIQYYRLGTWRSSWVIKAGRWLIAIGWTTLSIRIFERLYLAGDILISLPSLVSLVLIAGGSTLVLIFWDHDRDFRR